MKRLLPLLFLLLLALGCKPRTTSVEDVSTATPLPTSTAKDYPVVVSPACQLGKFEALRTRQAQGDLLAWDPSGSRLAFAGPGANSNWYSGRLYLVSGPEYTTPIVLAPQTELFGSLVWSPDGKAVAFVAFRPPDTYTVMTANPANGRTIDLFSNQDAHTDPYGGSKVVQEWRTDGTLRVLTSCGDDCDQMLSINTNTGEVIESGEQIRKARDRLFPRPSERKFEETSFPPDMRTPTPGGSLLSVPQMKAPDWTRDGKKAVYIDTDLYAWVLMADQKVQYELDTPNTNVQEAKWAPDGRYLALRTDDNVIVFDTGCVAVKK
jgi:dipeptidyl aminopeptidase/acylaminoacyl peptidase